MYLSKYFQSKLFAQSGVLEDFVRQSHLTNVGGLKKLGLRCYSKDVELGATYLLKNGE